MTRKRITVSLAAAMVGLALLTGAGCEEQHAKKVEQCNRQGGVVQDDYETKVEVKNGKRTVKTTKEYECVTADGTELFEWK